MTGKDTATPFKKRHILVTSALPYANGSIHVGHIVGYVQADIWVRFQNMRGHECTYVCADDTHGTPIMVKARELGIKPEEFIAGSHAEHSKDFADFGVGFNIYSSTHTEENRILSEEFYTKMRDNGHTAVRSIQQLYCDHDKMFLPDRFVKGSCPNCGSPDQYGDSCDHCGATYSPSELKGVVLFGLRRKARGTRQRPHLFQTQRLQSVPARMDAQTHAKRRCRQIDGVVRKRSTRLGHLS